jgi:hypothetical protein
MLPAQEYNYLEALFLSTNGEFWYQNSNWNFENPDEYNPCIQSWYGVVVIYPFPANGNDCFIQNINLDGNNLSGTLPSEVADFMYLKSIFFNCNRLKGPLPLFRNDPALQSVQLTENSFSGPVPELMFDTDSSLSLKSLLIGSNQLNGTIPLNLYNLKLMQLDLSLNHFTGTISTQLQNWSGMVDFDLSENHFNGSLPLSMALLTRISRMNLYMNDFTGEVLYLLEYWPMLSAIIISENSFTGTLPNSFLSLKQLKGFVAEDNYFSGTIPSELPPDFAIPTFQLFAVNGNFFHGPFPHWLCLGPQVVGIELSSNYFTGTIPDCIRNLRDLEAFQIDYNHFSGDLSNVFAKSLNSVLFPWLQYISIGYNEFGGTIPEQIFHLQRLFSFSAVQNCFHGSLSNEICNGISPTIEYVNLAGLRTSLNCVRHSALLPSYYADRMLGGIPSCLWNLPRLQSLYLSGNHFTGSIPSNLSLASNFTTLSLSHNYLTGTIPLGIQQHEFHSLDLSYNKFIGDIESFAWPPVTCQTNCLLNLTHNRLSGLLPSSFADAPNIEVLYGNVFDCATHLPVHDNYYSNYFCGSAELDISMISFAVSFGFFSIFLVITQRWRVFERPRNEDSKSENSDNDDDSAKKEGNSICSRFFPLFPLLWENEITDFAKEFPSLSEEHYLNIANYGFALTQIVHFVVCVACFLVFVILPVYIGLNSGDRRFIKYDQQYDWILTSSYLTGIFPSIMLALLWLSILTFPIIFIKLTHQFDKRPQDTVLTTVRDISSSLFGKSKNLYHRFTQGSSSSSPSKLSQQSSSGRLTRDSYSNIKTSDDYDHEPEEGDKEQEEDEYGPNDDLATDLLLNTHITQAPALSTDTGVVSTNSRGGKSAIGASSMFITFSEAESEHIPTRQLYYYYFVMMMLFLFNITASVTINYFYLAEQATNMQNNEVIKYLLQIAMAVFKLFWNLLIIPLMVNFMKRSFYFITTGQTARFHVILLVINTVIAPCIAAIATDEACFQEVFIEPLQETMYRNNQLQYLNGTMFFTFVLSQDSSFTLPFMYYSTCGSKILTTYIPIFMYTYTILPIMNHLSTFTISRIPLDYIPLWLFPKIRGVLRPQDFGKGVFRTLMSGYAIMAGLVLHITVLLTFGLNSPILAATITIAIILECFAWKYWIKRFIEFEDKQQKHRSSNSNFIESAQENPEDEEENSTLEHRKIIALNASLEDAWFCFYQTRWTVFYCSLFFCTCVLYDFASDEIGFLAALWVPGMIVLFLLLIRLFLTDIIQFFQFRSRPVPRAELESTSFSSKL